MTNNRIIHLLTEAIMDHHQYGTLSDNTRDEMKDVINDLQTEENLKEDVAKIRSAKATPLPS